MFDQMTPAARALLARARELAQEGRSFRCGAPHVLWACVEHEPGEEARKLRSSCKHGPGQLTRRPDALPPFDERLVELLNATTETIGSKGLFELICSSTLPARVQKRLLDWQTPPTNEAPEDAPPAEPTVPWVRLEYDDGVVRRVLELARDGATIYARVTEINARTGHVRGDTAVEIKTLASEKNAVRSFQRRIDNAVKKEHIRTDDVHLPLPAVSTRDLRAQDRERRQSERRRRLEEFPAQVLAFFDAWHRLGYDPSRTFHQEGQTQLQKREDGSGYGLWNDIAQECVDLAGEVFRVYFSFRTEVDEEHGFTGAVGERHYAQFYVSPSEVARMALGKIRDGSGDIDGGFPPWRASTATKREPDDEVSSAMAQFQAKQHDR